MSVGDVFLNKHGDVALVTEYISCTEVYVVFDGYDKTVKFNASNLKAGRFRNKEKPDNFGTTLGGTYCTKVHKSVYARWRNMIRRCGEKYLARISVSGKQIHLGTFLSLELAIDARRQAELKYYGELKPEARESK